MDGTKIPETGAVTLRLNVQRYEEHVHARGWFTTEQQARGLQLGMGTISRIRNKQQRGARLVASLRRAFPEVNIWEFFDVVSVEELARERDAA